MSDTILPMPSLAVKWVHALLSGKYSQGDGVLGKRYVNGNADYCCLGVAAAVCFPESSAWAEPIADFAGVPGIEANFYVEADAEVLPPSVWRELIGDEAFNNGGDESYQHAIAEHNDRGESFRSIVFNYILPLYNITSIEQFEEIYGPVPNQP